MKIIKYDYLDTFISDIVPATIDILLDKIDNNQLEYDDYDMIKNHLSYYKELLLNSELYNNNKEKQNGQDN